MISIEMTIDYKRGVFQGVASLGSLTWDKDEALQSTRAMYGMVGGQVLTQGPDGSWEIS